ncbi:MAG TPA: tetratricopeptide repeat protein [Thermoanaerobaculia bacterium]|nr:tetratricopeptide repeat protein [Thermoanaerobaculia bacterium]
MRRALLFGRRTSRPPRRLGADGTSALILLLLAFPLGAQERLASDFEIAQMEQQLLRAKGFSAQVSARLNLGDLRATRNEQSLARAEYLNASGLAEAERLDARRESAMSRYANATSYAALAQAKLGRKARAFELLEEAARYASDDAENWNLYASAMRILGHPRKAAAAARNAVALAKEPLDVAIYQHALATALIESGEVDEAERLLVTVTESLRSSKFASLQRDVARGEAFEVYSTARGDVAAYVSLLNRAQLRLAALYEQRGQTSKARTQYERVLAARSDDVTALTALGRWAEAFEANPFSPALVATYRRVIPSISEGPPAGNTTGAQMRRALIQLARGEHRAARTTLDGLLEKFPANETLRTLRRETERKAAPTLPGATPTAEELRALIETFEQLTPEQRVTLDRTTFTSDVVFTSAQVANGQTTFESGTIGGVPFRFSEPTVFNGVFDVRARLTYRILGRTADVSSASSGRAGRPPSFDRDALLLDPAGVQ